MGLSEMNPSQALANRSMCVDMLKVPSFMLKLTLKHPEDLVSRVILTRRFLDIIFYLLIFRSTLSPKEVTKLFPNKVQIMLSVMFNLSKE